MKMRVLALLSALLVLPAFISTAEARPAKRQHHAHAYSKSYKAKSHRKVHRRAARHEGRRVRKASSRRHRVARSAYNSSYRSSLGYSGATASYSSSRRTGVGGRPSKWCGWWMRTQRGGGAEMNIAWNWRNYGSAAAPQVGAVVVWRHHVGQIVGRSENGQWLVQSGNDGGAVRTRARSLAGAIVRM